MKKFIFFILLMFSFESSFGGDSIDIFCKRDISYSYINGILNDEASALATASSIRDNLNIRKNIKTAFNKSEGYGVIDIARAIFQKYEESGSMMNKVMIYAWSKTGVLNKVDNRQEVINRLNEQSKGFDEHVVFSHSQGNMYANIACKSKKLNMKFRNIQIASPASRIECGKPTHYTTINSDEMYLLVNSAAKGRINLEDDSPYTLLLKGIGTLGSTGALLAQIQPPLKANVIQPVRFVASTGIDKSKDSYFRIHSMDNYLNYNESLTNIKNNFKEVSDQLKPDDKILTSKYTNIDCKNVDTFLNQSITATSFSVKGQRFVASTFMDYHIEKKEKDGEYVFLGEFKIFSFILALILSVPIIFLILKCFAAAAHAHSVESDRLRREKEQRK